MSYNFVEDALRDSDDEGLEDAMKLSLLTYQAHQSQASTSKRVDSRAATQETHVAPVASTSTDRIYKLETRLAGHDAEIRDLEETIRKATESLEAANKDRNKVIEELKVLRQQRTERAAAANSNAEGSRPPPGMVDYMSEFDWTGPMRVNMRTIFGIQDFRMCQAGVCNANMDGRDIICVMPTGGGKSLTYQLPAIMAKGCTLVVSPLISLMTDQIMHLEEAGDLYRGSRFYALSFAHKKDLQVCVAYIHTPTLVRAVMLSTATGKAEFAEIGDTFRRMARGECPKESEIKLCYVTPERMAKSGAFKSMMQQLVDARRLDRIVIDEAHCISSQGHDFRTDYTKLGACRQSWPRVPILALSATCPPPVLKDIMKQLGLEHLVPGQAASNRGTVYFASPLYRRNLHYKVFHKHSAYVIKEMIDFILTHHPKDSGIIYCFSRKETEAVASGIREQSGDKIKTGVYHAEVADKAKLHLHEKWRDGHIQVVCATIAFGMGIDKGDVRFVIHHTMPKSLDGFYQESGRAGRDGQDADCVLYYRPQDALHNMGLAYQNAAAQKLVREIQRFAHELQECRKIQFANYFNMSASLSKASWTTEYEDAMERCGHCDNCTRDPETVVDRDVTEEAWKILKAAEAVGRRNERVTHSQLVDLVRGTGKGQLGRAAGRRGRGRVSHTALDIDSVVGGKIDLSKYEVERICVQLSLDGFLHEWLIQTNHGNVNVYVQAHPQSSRITHRPLEDIRRGTGYRVNCTFPVKTRKQPSAPRKKRSLANLNEGTPKNAQKAPRAAKRRKSNVSQPIYSDIESADEASDQDEDPEDQALMDDFIVQDEDDDTYEVNDEGWSHTLASSSRTKAPARSTRGKNAPITLSDDDDDEDDGDDPRADVISISSD